jgi:hypothetical protein
MLAVGRCGGRGLHNRAWSGAVFAQTTPATSSAGDGLEAGGEIQLAALPAVTSGRAFGGTRDAMALPSIPDTESIKTETNIAL